MIMGCSSDSIVIQGKKLKLFEIWNSGVWIEIKVKSDFGESLIFFVVWDEKREKGKIMNLSDFDEFESARFVTWWDCFFSDLNAVKLRILGHGGVAGGGTKITVVWENGKGSYWCGVTWVFQQKKN